MSHLLQMRGLKRDFCYTFSLFEQSHLLQMRGLKLTPTVGGTEVLVASFTDAWIETMQKRVNLMG